MWYHHLSEQSNIGVTQLGGNTTEFSNLSKEMKVYILRKTFGSNPGRVASGLANIENVSREWRDLALTELWKLAAKELFTPQQLENAWNQLFQQFNREPSWKEVYLSLITRTVWMTSESDPKTSPPLYILAGSRLRFYGENTGNTEMFYLIHADKGVKSHTTENLLPEFAQANLFVNRKTNWIDKITVSANYWLTLKCISSLPSPKCTGFAQMTLI